MPDKKEKTENLFEKWRKDFASERLPASLLRTSDPRLRERAGQIYRGLGFILCFIVLYLIVFDFFPSSSNYVKAWIGTYLGYLIILEVIRFQKKAFFDDPVFRFTRIIINITFITLLLAVPSNAKFIVGLFYTIPIFAAIVYFPKDRVKLIAVGFLVTTSLLFAEIIMGGDIPLTFLQFIFNIFVLVLFSFGFFWFQNNIVFGTDVISQISEHLYTTLDIDKLAKYIVQTSKKLAHADRSLLIVIDPDQKTYINHAEIGFDLKDGCTIEDVARKCYVLSNGVPFDCEDMTSYFNDRDIYSKFFKCKPQSVFAVPLMNNDQKVVGVLNVASDKPNQFDDSTKDLILGFSNIASNAAENSLTYRQLKLTEIKGRSLESKFANARDQREIFGLILEGVKSQFKSVNCVIHKLENKVMKKSENIVLTPVVWDADIYERIEIIPSSFEYGTSLAGHALILRQPILANDVGKDPRYLQRKEEENINSLLVCPMYDPNSEESYGVINLFSDEIGFFTTSDEIKLTSLAHQASLAFSRMRELEKWQEQGGILRKILNEVRYIDFGKSDEVLCHQLAETATKLLGFKIARIRILDEVTDDLVTVAFCAPTDHPISEYIGHRMPKSVLDPFITNKYEYERSFVIPHEDKRWREVADKYFYVPKTKNKARDNHKWKPYDAIITPLIDSGGKMIGLLTLDLPKSGSYPDKQILEPISTFANIAAWAIQLSHYQHRWHDQSNRTKSFIDTISGELSHGHDFQTIGEVIVQVGAKFMNAEGCNLFIVKEKELELTHSSYLANTNYIGRRKPICSKAKCGLTGWVAEKGKVLIFNNEDYKHHPSWGGEKDHLSFISSKVCKSILLAPVFNKEQNVIGVISLENKKKIGGLGEFDELDIERLTNIALQLSMALDRIGRYEAIKKWESKGLEDDLHFLINWYRFGVVANIEKLENVLYNDDLLGAKKILPGLIRNARNSVNELKALHTLIINECLEADNLKDGLIRLIDAWKKRAIPYYSEDVPMKINLIGADNLEIEPALRNTIIRISSEALSNAIFHSGIIENPKYKIDIILIPKPNEIELKVIDDGLGTETLRDGVGIDRMKQLVGQVNSWGGIKSKLILKSRLGKGTSVRFIAKYKRQ